MYLYLEGMRGHPGLSWKSTLFLPKTKQNRKYHIISPETIITTTPCTPSTSTPDIPVIPPLENNVSGHYFLNALKENSGCESFQELPENPKALYSIFWKPLWGGQTLAKGWQIQSSYTVNITKLKSVFVMRCTLRTREIVRKTGVQLCMWPSKSSIPGTTWCPWLETAKFSF